MARYRKKPVVIEAVRWYPGTRVAGVTETEYGTAFVHTPEGRMSVTPGDWIITGLMGEKYPCKPEIFAATYEPADED